MTRPRKKRFIGFSPNVTYYKPRGVPLKSLEEIALTIEELEALRLKNIEDLDQVNCALKMQVSQSTFQRILTCAYKKVSIALVMGKAIKINNK